MSETIKTADTAKRAADQSARTSHAAIDAAGKANKDVIHETSRAAHAGVDQASQVGDRMTETVVETAGLSASAAEQGRDALLMGVRTAADVGCRFADIGFGRGHHMLASATQAMDVYRDASDRSAECMQALFAGYLTFGRGLQAIQHAWLESADHAIETATHKPRDLLRCKNVIELAEVQRDLYIDALNHAVESTTRLLDIAGRTAQDTVRSLQSSAH